MADARTRWGEGLVAISSAFEREGLDRARSVAEDLLDSTYAYGLAPVLFKPTMASGAHTFRPSRRGALSYFVGHDPDFPLDRGFGLMGWRHVASVSSHHLIEGKLALWMGWMILTNKAGETTKVDKTFGYMRDAAGNLRIVLHHSSLPYQPEGSGPDPAATLAPIGATR